MQTRQVVTSGGGEACPSLLLLPSSPNKSVPAQSLRCLLWWWGAGYWLTETLLASRVKNLWKHQRKYEWCSMFTFVICLCLGGVSREEQGVLVWGLDRLFLGKNAAYTGSTYTWYVQTYALDGAEGDMTTYLAIPVCKCIFFLIKNQWGLLQCSGCQAEQALLIYHEITAMVRC